MNKTKTCCKQSRFVEGKVMQNLMRGAEPSLHTEYKQSGFLCAHIQNVGDVSVSVPGRVGNRKSEQHVEGFALSLGSEQLNDKIEYQILYENGSLSERVCGGAYCGTKGENLPIYGFKIFSTIKNGIVIQYEGSFKDGSRCGPLSAGELCKSVTKSPLVEMRVILLGALPADEAKLTGNHGDRPISPSSAALLRGFVSMGGNCEFGIVQRLCGIEPLDLLRWANTDMGVLQRLLRNRFRRLGDASVTRLLSSGNEYIVENTLYGFVWHTHGLDLGR